MIAGHLPAFSFWKEISAATGFLANPLGFMVHSVRNCGSAFAGICSRPSVEIFSLDFSSKETFIESLLSSFAPFLARQEEISREETSGALSKLLEELFKDISLADLKTHWEAGVTQAKDLRNKKTQSEIVKGGLRSLPFGLGGLLTALLLPYIFAETNISDENLAIILPPLEGAILGILDLSGDCIHAQSKCIDSDQVEKNLQILKKQFALSDENIQLLTDLFKQTVSPAWITGSFSAAYLTRNIWRALLTMGLLWAGASSSVVAGVSLGTTVFGGVLANAAANFCIEGQKGRQGPEHADTLAVFLENFLLAKILETAAAENSGFSTESLSEETPEEVKEVKICIEPIEQNPQEQRASEEAVAHSIPAESAQSEEAVAHSIPAESAQKAESLREKLAAIWPSFQYTLPGFTESLCRITALAAGNLTASKIAAGAAEAIVDENSKKYLMEVVNIPLVLCLLVPWVQACLYGEKLGASLGHAVKQVGSTVAGFFGGIHTAEAMHTVVV